MDVQPPNTRSIFERALEFAQGGERKAYLDDACAGRPELRTQVESLLKAHGDAGSFLDGPAFDGQRTSPMEPIAERPGTTIGPYKLLEQIGEGGFGVVFMAEQEQPIRRRVAVKVIKPGMDTRQVIARFEAERQALALMDHPNIARVLDAGATDSGRPYFVMELVRGVPITEFCDHHRLTVDERLKLFATVCQAVQHAHQKGIIHRDIKPTNVLVTLHDGEPVAKVIDFGVAKATGQRLTDKTIFTSFAQMIGTPLYMSPEQTEMSGLDVDTRSDIYSLGVMLYELLTGTTPFDKERLQQAAFDEIRRIIREEETPKPSTRISTLGATATAISTQRQSDPGKLSGLLRGELDWIVMKCLEKDRSRRYESASALGADVQRHLENEPVHACPPSASYRFRKFALRNRVALAMTAVFAAGLMALITSLGVSNVLISRHSHAREVALREKSEALEAAKAEKANAIAHQHRAEHESVLARHASAQSESRLFIQQHLLPAAIKSATNAQRLGGQWEDGLLLDEIVTAARRNWVLTARVPLSGSPGPSCMVAGPDRPWLVVRVGNEVRAFDAATGAAQGAAALKSVKYVFPATQRTAFSVGDSDVTLFSLPQLTPIATRSFSDPITLANAQSDILLLFHRSGTARILTTPKLEDVDSFVWNDQATTKELPLPTHLCVSPDGLLALLHGGHWWEQTVLWDRRPGATPFTKHKVIAHRAQFIDNTRVATWFAADSLVETEIRTYSFEHPASPTTLNSLINGVSVFDDDTKGIQSFQAWSEGKAVAAALVGNSGLVLTSFGADNTRVSDRFANLLPNEPPPKFLALDARGRRLAMARDGEVLLFKHEQFRENGHNNTDDFCATPCRDGLLHVFKEFGTANVHLQLDPFDVRRSPIIFNLQWPADSIWLPWALAATHDGTTIAVIAQETDKNNWRGSIYGRVRALLYHPHSLNESGEGWKLDQAFEVDAPSGTNDGARFAVLDPDSRALIYWTAGTAAVGRYDPKDGHLLGQMEFGPTAARSNDGARIATVTNGRRLRVYQIATGKTLLDLPGKSSSALCFSPDGTRIVSREDESVVTYDIKSSQMLSSLSTDLLPLAVLPSANRLLAFQQDQAEPGGSVVLADASTGQVDYVLNRTANAFTPAFFSESGRELAIVSDRWTAKVVRSLRPEELGSALQTGLAQEFAPTLPPKVVITSAPQRPQLPITRAIVDALDVQAFSAQRNPIGSVLTIKGRVGLVTITRAQNAMNIEYDISGSKGLMVWIPPYVFRSLDKELGQNPASALNGRTICVRGRVEQYGGHRTDWKDRLQLTVQDPHEFWLMDNEPISPATAPANSTAPTSRPF